MSFRYGLLRAGRWLLVALLFAVVAICLAVAIVPHFLDRIYYRGPVSAHFDGARFANPDGDEDTARVPAGGSRAGFFARFLTGSDGRRHGPMSPSVTCRYERGSMARRWSRPGSAMRPC